MSIIAAIDIPTLSSNLSQTTRNNFAKIAKLFLLGNQNYMFHSKCLSLCLTSISVLSHFLLLVSPVQANNHKKADADTYVRMPLLYMTDRAISDEGFLNKRKHEKDSIYEVYCGSLEYTIENKEQKKLNPAREKLGWHYENKEPKYPLEEITLDTSQNGHSSYEEFDKEIIATAQKTGAKELFIYLHGFNNPFSGAARSAARLAYYTECPVILYSWPSAGKILQYHTDVGNNEWSQEHFNHFLEELLKIKEQTGLKFSLFAHSMGIKIAVRAAPILKGKQLFENIFLINPDFDTRTFVHYISRFLAESKTIGIPVSSDTLLSEIPASYCNRLRILFSSKDNALPIVQFLYGGYTRLGQGADELLETLFEKTTIIPDKAIDSTDLAKFNHKYHPEEETEEEEITNLEQTGNRKTFEWIDYAKLDYGMLGHSIPFKLVANLWATDKPGDGLELVTAEHGNYNRFTRFSAWFFGIPEHVGTVGKCQKVITLNH